MADAIAKGIIDIGVKGSKSVDKVLKSTRELRQVIKDLNSKPITLNKLLAGEGTKAQQVVRAVTTEINNYTRAVVNGTKALANNEASLVRQGSAFSRVAANAKIGSVQYVNAVQAQEKAEQKLRFAQFERLKAQQQLYGLGRMETTESFRGIPELLKFSSQVPNTIAALSAYKAELQNVFELVDRGSDEYQQLGNAIKKVTNELNNQKLKTVKPPRISSTATGLTGREGTLKESQRVQEGINALTVANIKATIGVKQAQFGYNVELLKARATQLALNADINAAKGAWNGVLSVLKRGTGLLGGLLGGKGGKLGQAAGIIGVSSAVEQLIQKVPLLSQKWKDNIQTTANWVQRSTEGITAVSLAYSGLSNALSAAAWVSGAVSGFVRFEQAAVETFHKVNAARIQMERDSSTFQQNTLLQNIFGPLSQMIRGRMGNKLKEIYGGKDAGFEEGGSFRGMADRTPYGERLTNELENARKKLAELRSDNDKFADQVKKVVTLEARVTEEVEKQNKVKEETLAVQRKLQSMEARDKDPNRKNKETEDQIAAGVQANKNFDEKMRQIKEEREARLQLIRDEQEAMRKRFRQEAQERAKQSQKRMQAVGRFGENVMLGAGFPMLFGGGVGAVGGGLAGAVTQSAMGSKGFGAQILFSAVGQQLDAFAQKARELGDALKRPSDALSALADMGIVVDEVFQKEVETLIAVGREAEAMTMVNKELARTIGADGIEQLTALDTAWDSMGDQLGKLKLQIMSDLVPAAIAVIKLVEKFVDTVGAQRLRSKAQELNPEAFAEAEKTASKAAIAANPNKGIIDSLFNMFGVTATDVTKGPAAEAYYKSLTEESKKIIQKEMPGFLGIEPTSSTFGSGTTTGITIGDKNRQLEEQIELLQRSFEIGSKAAEQEQEAAIIFQEQKQLLGDKLKLNEADFLKQVQKRDQLQENLEVWKQIKDVIAGGLTNAITGLIEGTKTLGESLAGIAKQIANLILQKAILSAVDKAFTFGSGGVAKGGTGAMVAADNLKYGNTFPAGSFSTGGMVTRPTVGLVGAAGEDEYIIPASKMASSMQRYSAGARGEAVIPGTGSSYAGGGVGGSTTVDYSGPILNFNSEEFVPKSAVGEIIATATSRGARAGEARALSSLQNSRSKRSNIGL